MLIIVVLVTFFLTLVAYKTIIKKKHFKLPPGPSGLPLVGNVLQLGSSPFLKHDEFSKQFGDMHTISIFGHTVVVLSSMEAVKDCSFGSSDAFNHRPVWLKNVTKSIAPGIAFRGVDNYIENRRFVLNNLKKRGMGKSELEPRIVDEAELLISHIQENSPVDPTDVLGNYTSNVISQICFARRWDYGDPAYAKFHQAIMKITILSEVLGLVDFVPILGYLPNFKTKSIENFENVDYIRNFFRKIIDTKRKENTDGIFDGFDIVDDYLNTHKDMTNEETENLVDICQDLFFAGTDTTSATLGFAIIHLINNPKFQDDFFDEIDQVLKGRNPSLTDLQNLPFVEATIQETLRVNPNVPLIFHATKNAAPLRNYQIPQNTMVSINAYSVNNDVKYFEDPFTFNPHRWISESGKFRGDLVDKLATFGAGRRSCPGKPLARMEMFIFLVKLMQNFKLSVPAGHPMPDGNAKGGSAALIPDAFLLKVTKRETL
eukprot:GFUD01043755.1.p1 GENE.GFUD01043755.1~~GFUD01043755.1.p1  ORF type:complete len:487 (-),score=103.82 GFUD01043755.1:69-1529(-)